MIYIENGIGMLRPLRTLGTLFGILDRFGRKPTQQTPTVATHGTHETAIVGETWTAPGHEATDQEIASARPWEQTTEPVISGVPAGWVPSRWVRELRRLADCCRSVRPDRANIHETEAGRVEAMLRKP